MPPFVPRAVCAKCQVAFKPKTNGVDLQATLHPSGEVYYKVAADLWQCTSCGAEIYVGFGKPIERHDPLFVAVLPDDIFYL